MALIRNGVSLNANPMRVLGGPNANSINRPIGPGAQRGFYAGEGTVVSGSSIADTAAFPNGYEGGSAWLLAPRGGGFSAYTTFTHPNVVTAALASGISIEATLTSDGTITTAAIQALANLVSTLTSDGAVTTAAITTLSNLVASLTATTTVTAAIQALANLAATLTADGSISNAELSLVVGLACSMVSDGSISTANLKLVVGIVCTMLSDCGVSSTLSAPANLAATLLASNNVTGALSALSNLICEMTANGSLVASLRGTLSMSAVLTTAGSSTDAPTPAEIAVAVWQYVLSGVTAGDRLSEVTAARMSLLSTELDPSLSGSTAAQMVLARKILHNRLEVDIASQRLVLYDDDNTTVLRRWPLQTTGGEPVTTSPGVQTKRRAPT